LAWKAHGRLCDKIAKVMILQISDSSHQKLWGSFRDHHGTTTVAS